MFIFCQDYVRRTLIDLTRENGFRLKKTKSRLYPAETKIDIDYAEDIKLLVNTPAQAEYLQQGLEQAAEGIGFDVNENKTELICFKSSQF